MSVRIDLELNGMKVPVVLDEKALAAIAAALPHPDQPVPSPYSTIPEAAAYLRCSRQRVDDLLSQRRLTRFKEGRRTLILRSELERHTLAFTD